MGGNVRFSFISGESSPLSAGIRRLVSDSETESERPASLTQYKDGETKGLKQIRGPSALDDSAVVSYCPLETKPR